MSLKHVLKVCLLSLLLLASAAPAWSDETDGSWEKVVFHVDEMVNARWSLMLARSYLDDNPKAKIVFVVYGPGIDFLMDDVEDKHGNPYDPAVGNLAERGVGFRACAATLAAREIAKEDLLDQVSVVPSGISEIVRLQIKEGYAYLKP